MKREVLWWTGFVIVTIILIGQMSAFTFGHIDVQLHDIYYVFPSWFAMVVVLTILGVLRGLTKLIDWLSDRSRLLAALISIIIGLSGVALIVVIGASIRNLMQIRKWNTNLDMSGYIGIIGVFISILVLLTITEIRTIKKLKTTKR